MRDQELNNRGKNVYVVVFSHRHYTIDTHSFEVNIRICQPENSDVHGGEAGVNITLEG